MLFGDKNDLLVPALIGLGIYAQSKEVNLANNTSILLILFLLLNKKDHCHHGYPGIGYPPGYYPGAFSPFGQGFGGGARYGGEIDFPRGFGGGSPGELVCFRQKPQQFAAVPLRTPRVECEVACDCDHHGHSSHHGHHHGRDRCEEEIERKFRRIDRHLERIERCACHGRGSGLGHL